MTISLFVLFEDVYLSQILAHRLQRSLLVNWAHIAPYPTTFITFIEENEAPARFFPVDMLLLPPATRSIPRVSLV